jgi:hypothetical protein
MGNESLLEHFVYVQPLPALISILMVSGMLNIGMRLSCILFSPKPSAIEVAASYVITIMIIGLLGDAYLHKLIPIIVLKIIGLALLFSGVFLFKELNSVTLVFKKFAGEFKLQPSYYKASTVTVVLISILLFLSSLAPPTDADSLDYHLGLPLSWLSADGYAPHYNWFHARFSGLGERVILFGLANGTDVLSSLIQWSGLVIAIISLNSLSKKQNYQDFMLSSLLVLSVPVILFLTLNQKPYLFPAASIILAVSLYFKNGRKSNIELSAISFILVASVLFKYTFILSVFGMVLVILYDSFFIKKSKKILYWFTLFFLVLMVPYYVRNYIFFNDPLSPLLSSFLSVNNPALVLFMESMKIGYSFNMENVMKIPFTQGLITFSPGLISTIIGLGGALILMSIRSKIRKSKLLISAFLISFFIIVILGRPISRLMFDVYLLGSAALVVSEFDRYKDFTIKVLSLQSLGVLLMSLYSVYILFPGVVSNYHRDVVLLNNASGYSASKELKKLLPVDSILLTDIRSKSLLPGKVVLSDAFQYTKSISEVEKIILYENNINKITHVALISFNNKHYESIMNCADKTTKKLINVTKATRNPLNKSQYMFIFFKINDDKSCFLNS